MTVGIGRLRKGFSVFARAGDSGFFGGGDEVLDPVAAVFFGGIKAGVSLIQQCFQIIFSVVGGDGDSHAHGDEFLVSRTSHRRAGNDFAQLIGALHGVGQIAVGQNHEKFFSAIAAHAVVNAKLFAQAASDFAQRFIAEEVTERVVYIFEVIDVAENHAHGRALAAGSLQLAAQHGDNLPSIH